MNYRSIVSNKGRTNAGYFHLDLDSHQVLLANVAPTAIAGPITVAAHVACAAGHAMGLSASAKQTAV